MPVLTSTPHMSSSRITVDGLSLRSIASRRLSSAQKLALFSALTDRQLTEFYFDWAARAREEQLPPGSYRSANQTKDWQKWLYLGGRGVRKNRTRAEWIRAQVD